MRPRARSLLPSLHGRLLALLMVALGTLLAFNLWSDYRAAGEYTQEAYDQALADTAVALAAHVHTDGQKLAFDLPLEATRTLGRNRLDDMYYLVERLDGTFLTGNQDLPSAQPQAERSPTFYDAAYRGSPVRVVVYRSGTTLGDIVVKVAETTRRRDQL